MPSIWPQFSVIFSLYPEVYSFSCEMIGERGYCGITSQNFRALKDPSSFLPLAQHFHFRDKVFDNQRDLRVFQVHQAGSVAPNPQFIMLADTLGCSILSERIATTYSISDSMNSQLSFDEKPKNLRLFNLQVVLALMMNSDKRWWIVFSISEPVTTFLSGNSTRLFKLTILILPNDNHTREVLSYVQNKE